MTEELFRQDSYQTECTATVQSADSGGIILDRTVFYPNGGGQPGDIGVLRFGDQEIPIVDTRKGDGGILHIPADEAVLPAVGETVTCEIDWSRRYRHMRMHTCMHVLCSLIDGAVTGGQAGADKSRLDFDIPGERPDKDQLTARLMALVEANHPLTITQISDAELAANPDLVRTMSVQPPTGAGHVRMIRIGEDIDFQPCGGTHLKATGEIGAVRISKIENKGKQNRRISIVFDA
jgi:misacylated tRNA(Ala) deacylase